ncbi:MAG: phosphoglucomutase/phosphomannomutase family protein [Synechococcales bacterium]|nr:phosphoglucomutase/phosphomannomutase family protein [Synechococcales bacterium]
MAGLSLVTAINPIKFGTDGWRGVIAADFTFERVALVAPLAAHVLHQVFGAQTGSKTIVVGYDRRFLSEEFAQVAADRIQAAGYDVLFSECFAPTPAFSWAAKQLNALGAIVITASHNPGAYSGLKVKGAFGGSVPPEVTQKIEAMLADPNLIPAAGDRGQWTSFNPWTGYCEGLRKLVDIDAIRSAIAQGELAVVVDAMHGASSTGLSQLLGIDVEELHSDRDPLFEDGAPEPLPKYLGKLFDRIQTLRTHQQPSGVTVGLVFDGDCDRIAAVDGNGTFLSSQILIPILLEHLATRKGYQGEVVKTVSGSDLIPKVAELLNLPVYETPIGYKYIADRMLETQVLLGGEESGGIGYGHHIPERDALLAALYVLETLVKTGQDLGDLYRHLQQKTGFQDAYDRIDLPLASLEVRDRLIAQLTQTPLTEIAGQAILSCQTDDGYKYRLADGRWLLIRFSGTEPVLRLYCEAPTPEAVQTTLAWAKTWATQTP